MILFINKLLFYSYFPNCSHYYCHSSKKNELKDLLNRKRQEKKGKSVKRVEGNCPARLVVKLGDKVTVKWTKTHCGHELNPFDIRLTEEQRTFTTSLLEVGLHSDKVQKHIRQNVTPSKLKKQSLTSIRDVNNCRRSTTLDTQKGRLHQEDAISVDVWALHNLMQTSNIIVLKYKPQEEVQDNEADDEIDGLKKQDFVLVFMSNWQKEVARRIKDMDNIICMDGTYGLEGYKFNFNLLVVRNAYYRAVPIAQMYSTRETLNFIEIFLKSVRDEVGKLKATHFMSDDAGMSCEIN
jgi:hypothetical protein